MQRKFIPLIVMVSLFLSILACGGPPPAPSIGEVTTAKDVVDGKPVEPTDTFMPSDTIHVLVAFNYLLPSSRLTVKFKYEGQPASSEDANGAPENGGTGTFDAFLRPAKLGQAVGNYTAEIYLDEVLTKTVAFKVEQAGPPAISQIVIATGGEADQPGSPTDTYSPTDQFYIYAQGDNMLKGAQVDIKITYDGQPYSDHSYVVEIPGSQYFLLQVNSASGEHLTGTYDVEVYLDNNLALSSTFAVK